MLHIAVLYGGGEVAHTGDDGLENLIGDGLQGMNDGVIVAVKARAGKADELGNQNVVR